MSATTTKKLVDRLRGAGLNLSITEGGGLAVKPSDRLTDDLRGLLRDNRAALVDWLTTGKGLPLTPQAQASAPEPPTDPNAWHELAAAYNAHHFKCSTCIAAGRGAQYGLRCGVGAALWREYSEA